MTIDIETITDRTTYLAWRADWRRRYAAASEEVRSAKRDLVDAYAARLANAPRIQGRTHEYRIASIIERLPGLREEAHIVMSERALGTGRRDELLAPVEPEAIAA